MIFYWHGITSANLRRKVKILPSLFLITQSTCLKNYTPAAYKLKDNQPTRLPLPIFHATFPLALLPENKIRTMGHPKRHKTTAFLLRTYFPSISQQLANNHATGLPDYTWKNDTSRRVTSHSRYFLLVNTYVVSIRVHIHALYASAHVIFRMTFQYNVFWLILMVRKHEWKRK